MAWRDSRQARGRLLLFVMSMSIGVASLVAITSFGDNLQDSVSRQARDMLGADFRVRSRQPFSAETEALLENKVLAQDGAEEARQVSFTSMAWFDRGQNTRLVQVRALEGGYPFYGELETDPPSAAGAFRDGRRALVDGSLMAQFGAVVGDTIRIGRIDYQIAGALKRIPGESATSALFGPRVYVPLAHLDPELMSKGSRVTRYRYYRFDPGVDAGALREDLEEHAERHQIRVSTVESTEERTAQRMENLYGFLNLVGFVALLLGGLGVGSAIHVHVQRKIGTVATLRCLGAKAPETFAVYVASALVLGGFGALVGAGLGLGVQRLLPLVLADLMPTDVIVEVSWSAVLSGISIGLLISLAFALLPLLPLRRIPPLLALRSSLEPAAGGRDLARLLLMVAIGLFVFLYAWLQTDRAGAAAIYAAGLLVAFLALALCARLLRYLARMTLSRRFTFEWRQGLMNLYRPNNQTLLLMVSIGLGAFLVLTLYQMRVLLLDELSLADAGEQPNVVLFDIQDDQVEEIQQLVRDQGLQVRGLVPIVNMRLDSVKGRTVEQIRADEEDRTSSWSLTREYRSTYRDRLADGEELLEGEVSDWTPGDGGPAPVSLEQRISGELDVGIGDELVWDVQGVRVATVVGSIRKVDWRRMQPNFFAVFPAGVLEEAPKFFVLTTRATGEEEMGSFQRAVVSRFPNVSTIDVTLILEVADELLQRLSFVVQFMSLFSILTGLLVLVSSILTSRFQRLEEGVLLRTLGATRGKVIRIMNVEYLLLGSLATATGLLLSIAASFGLARFRFDLDFRIAWLPLLLALVLVTALTLIIGRLGSRGLHDRPPLEILRAEG